MEIIIKDALIKKVLAQHVTDCLDKPNPTMVREIFADSKFQKSLQKGLSLFLSQSDDIIADLIQEVDIPQLNKALKDKFKETP